MPLRSWWPTVVLAALVACSKSPEQPQTPQTGERITGSEKIGWTQSATDSATLSEFSYAIYVDGARSQLANPSCGDTPSSAGFDCSAPLPRMSSGSHTLEIAAYVVDDTGTILESSKSTPLQVIVSTSLSAARRGAPTQPLPDTSTAMTADGVRLRIDVVSRSLDMPTDVAATPDGRLFVAERSGRIHVIRDGEGETPAAAPPFDRDPAGGELLALAIDPRFDSTHFVYAISVEPGRSGPTFVLSRLRESHDTFGDRAVLVDDVPASGTPAASLRFGPDGKLYAALDDGGVPAVAGDLAAFNGKILRLNSDGSTPDDQAGGTPVYSYEYRSPRGFDWQPNSGTLWISDGAPDGAARLRAVGGSVARPRRSTTLVTYSVPGLFGASTIAFYRGDLLPEFRGDLFLAADAGQHVLRIRFDRQNPTRVVATERLFESTLGGVRVVFVRADGVMFLGTSHELLRVRSAGP
jgi:aldose sugar dehydrogenase